jgi:hypothetical protein
MTNKLTGSQRRLASLQLDYEDEDENEGIEEIVSSGNGSFGISEGEDEPDPFIPIFTVAPDDIPIGNIPDFTAPTEEEQQNILKKMYDKLGVNVNKVIHEPSPPMTPEKDAFVRMSSRLSAGILSTTMAWVFMIPGYEYAALAPDAEGMERIVTPLWRIYARHSKIVANITPDMEDIVNCLTAISAEALVSAQLYRKIQEDKAHARTTEIYQRPVTTSQGQAQSSDTYSRPADIRRGDTTVYNEPHEDSGYPPTVDTSNLTRDEQYNYDMLRQLSAKESENRYRRAGRI